jgi:hypothetical protein
MDYERVQLRIAARQAGLLVDDEDEGKIKWYAGTKLSQLQNIVIQRARRVDRVWDQRGFAIRKTSTRDVPGGFAPVLWRNPAMIQARIRRGAKSDRGDEMARQFPDHIDIVDGCINPRLLEIRPTGSYPKFGVPDGGKEQSGSKVGHASLPLWTAGGNLFGN